MSAGLPCFAAVFGWLLILVLAGSQGVLLVGPPASFDSWHAHSNEYRQALQLLVFTSNFSAAEYFSEFNQCAHKTLHQLTCMKGVNQRHGKQGRLWFGAGNEGSKKQTCKYVLQNYTLTSSVAAASIQLSSFTFKIYQQGCALRAPTEGGAEFQVTVTSASSLGSCGTTDHLDNTYDVHCVLPAVPIQPDRHSVHSSAGCVNVTVTLLHEHFDAFSDMLGEPHIPLQTSLLSNTQHCAPKTTPHAAVVEEGDHQAQPFDLHVPASVRWHSGFWTHSTLLKAPLTIRLVPMGVGGLGETPAGSAAEELRFQPILFMHDGPGAGAGQRRSAKGKEGGMLSSAHCHAQGWNDAICRSWEESPQQAAGKPKPTAKHGVGTHLTELDERTFMRNISHPSPVAHDHHRGHHRSHAHAGAGGQLAQFHFCGGTHLQDIFDATTLSFLGRTAEGAVHGKHHETRSVGNLHFTAASHARHLASHLLHLCARWHNESVSADVTLRTQAHVLVVQTGAGDLAVGPLRRISKDPTVGKRLISVLEGILTSRHPCGNVKQVVWVTAVPYPQCSGTSANAADCEAKRGFRTGGAVAAANYFYLQNLFRLATSIENDPELREHGRPRVQLSVVDAHGIVHPRVQQGQNEEFVCGDRFSCPVGEGGRGDGGHRVAGVEKSMQYTPGGVAMVASVFNALFMG